MICDTNFVSIFIILHILITESIISYIQKTLPLTMTINQSNFRLPNKKIQLVHQLPDLSELSYLHFEFMTSAMLIKRPFQPQHKAEPSCSLS